MHLTRTRIVAVAMDLVERHGPRALTMHQLAVELGCGLVPLYHHVPSRAALLDAVADAVASGIDCAPVPASCWTESVRQQARAARRAAALHPQCALLAATRPTASAARLRPAEHALATLAAAGFPAADQAPILHAFGAYVIGSVLLAAHAGGDEPAPVSAGADPCFDFGLDMLLRGATALLPTLTA